MSQREQERARMLEELELSRRQLDGDLEDLSHAVNVRERLADSVRRHPSWWVAGALAGGFLVASLAGSSSRGRRGKKQRDDSVADLARQSIFLGLLGSAGKQILRVAEPMLVRYAKQEMERFIASRTNGTPPSDSPPSP